MKKKMMPIFLAAVLVFILLPISAQAAGTDIDLTALTDGTSGDGYAYSGGVLTITGIGPFTITTNGTETYRCMIVNVPASTADTPVDITFDNVKINVSGQSDACALAIQASSTAKVTLQGNNVLKSGADRAGMFVPSGAEIIIEGTGALDVTGGNNGGAGIGGDQTNANSGSVTVNSGTIRAVGQYGAGIGGGFDGLGGSNGTLIVNGGTVIAVGGICSPGIGGGAYGGDGGTVIINSGIVEATGEKESAGIGGGYYGGDGGTVTINGGTVRASGGIHGGSGIGGGGGGEITGVYGGLIAEGKGGTVTINGGTVTATGRDGGAGIGGGGYGWDGTGGGGTVTITGGIVTATGGNTLASMDIAGGAGIGGGGTSYGGGGAGATVTIRGGMVKAIPGGTDGYGMVGFGIGGGGGYNGILGSHGSTVITGGSVQITGDFTLPTNGSSIVYLTTMQIDGITAATAISSLTNNLTYAYGITDVSTDDAGKLYLYLPIGAVSTVVETAAGSFTGIAITSEVTSLINKFAMPTSGADGKSAYELAVEKGYTGTEEEWLASLTGAKGATGAAGGIGATGATGGVGASGQDGTNGINGKTGVGIASITKTAATGNVDTYTVLLTNGTAATFTVTNGHDGVGIAGGKINESGELVFILTDGSSLNLGRISGLGETVPAGETAITSTEKPDTATIIALAIAVVALLSHLGWLIPLLIKKRNPNLGRREAL